jgi:hypothetical protein
MKRSWAVIAAIASVPLLVLGVIFLVAAAANPSRILVAAIFLLFGGALLTWGVLTLRRLAEISPESLATGIVDLARRLDGEVTVAQVQAEFGIPSNLAQSVLEGLRGRGECQREQRADHYAYVFKSVMPAKAIKRCPYCASEFSVRSAMRECPNCGASLEIVKE